MNKHKNGTLGIIIALSVAMVGGTMAVSYGAQQVEAAPPTWCYEVTGGNKCVIDPPRRKEI